MDYLLSGKNTEKQQISVTRALVELKTLDNRINKLSQTSMFISIMGELRTPDVKSTGAASNYDKITDLLSRRVAMKSAIVISNANTRIRICDMDLTVAETIELKSSIKNYETLLNTLKHQYGDASDNVEMYNEQTRNNSDTIITTNNLTKKENGVEITDITGYSKNYMKLHMIELYDPINIRSKIEKLEDFITKFKDEVDFILSEKNATTQINI